MFRKRSRVQDNGSFYNDEVPLFQFRWGRSAHWFKTRRIVGQVTVWTKFFSFSFGDSWPKDAGRVGIKPASHRRTGTRRRHLIFVGITIAVTAIMVTGMIVGESVGGVL